MNAITNITPATGLTMSSVEVAAYTGKRHLHVLRDIRKMLVELGEGETRFGSTYLDTQGKPHPAFNLPKRETMILVSGYSTQMRARIIDRWQELETMVTAASATSGTVTDFDAETRKIMGGIFKSVVHSELTSIIPALVRSELATQSLAFRHGRTAGQIWSSYGFPRIKITRWFSNRLVEMGCQIEGGGRAELGGRTCKLFDPDRAELWIKNGGRQLVEAYIAERQGQTKLRLVAAK